MQKLAHEVAKEMRDYLSLNSLSTHSANALLRQEDIDKIANEILFCAVEGKILSCGSDKKDKLYQNHTSFKSKAIIKNKVLRIHNDIKKLFPGDTLKPTFFRKHNNYLALFNSLYLGLVGRCENGKFSGLWRWLLRSTFKL